MGLDHYLVSPRLGLVSFQMPLQAPVGKEMMLESDHMSISISMLGMH